MPLFHSLFKQPAWKSAVNASAVLKGISLSVCPLLLLCACGGGGSSANAATSSSSSGGSSANYSQIATNLKSFVTSANNPPSGQVNGYAFMLIDQKGTVLYQTAAGNLSTDSVIAIASASKLPSALAILTLVDGGKLSLDTPVSTYLAGSAVTWPQSMAAITLRMLLSHTSGLPGLNDYNYPPCVSDYEGTTLAQCVKDIADGGLGIATSTSQPYQPGRQFDYGGADFQVAGYIATFVSGQPSWQDFFNAAIGTPLGLSSNFSYDAGAPNPRIAGGVSTDAADYVKLLQLVLNNGNFNGTQLISTSTIANSLEVNQIDGVSVAFNPLVPNSDYPGYSFGLFFSSPSIYSPSPGPEFSDPGAFGTTPWFDTGLEYGAIIMINQDTATGVSMWNAARPVIIQNLQGG
jgi:CubicO group peptidase (beta-lactamase class C family)